MKNLKSAYGDFFDEFLSEKEIESKELDPHRSLLYEMMEVKKQESIRKRKNLLIKYPLLGVIGLVTLVALVIGILCVSRFIQRSPLVEEMPSKVAGKTYVDDDFYISLGGSITGNALIFDEEASQYFIWSYTVPSDSNSITSSLCIGEYYPVEFSVNPFGKHVSLTGKDFYFTDENSITWGTDTYSTENISNLYLHLVSYLDSEQSKEDENRSLFQQLMQSLEQNQPELKTAKYNYHKE
ncbi:MAG: hypothetical protein IKC69_01345 [Clostridia bacterium]|nr:hypothetical protein [Clostridia bacterium]